MLCRLLLLALALCGLAHAAVPPRIDLTAIPALKGWSRPGRSTEIDVRLSTDIATRATLDVVAGSQSAHAELDLQPGRAMRLQVPVGSAEKVTVNVAAPGGPTVRRDIDIAQSESPLLGLGLATDGGVALEGFHAVTLAADDLPRFASAYGSVDALILDAPTLGALDQQQLAALLVHAARCGRMVVVNTDVRVRRVLDGAGGCGGRALMSAVSLADARDKLESSLATSLPTAMSLGGLGELACPGHALWNRVAAAVAVYFAAAALAVIFVVSLPVLLLAPALAAVAALAMLHAMQSPSQLIIWSEGESGAQSARYQAWQRFPGLVRERTRMAIPPQLASAVQPCDPNQAMRLDFDSGRGLAAFAAFETRLFRQVSLCYAGSFPTARALEVAAGAGGTSDVRNAGTKAWPPGALIASGLVHDLPALDPGAHAMLGAAGGKPPRDAAARTAMTRIRPDGMAALWPLDLGGVDDVPVGSKGWLLVSLPPR